MERRRRTTPPRWLALLLLAAAGAIAWLQSTDAVGDAGMANAFTYMLVLAAGAPTLLWFVLFSGHSRALRLGTAGVLTVLAVLAATLVRIEGWSGSIVPELAWRLGGERPELPVEASGDGEAVQIRPGPHDFPGYRGARRDGRVEGPALGRDWEARPPRELWRVPVGEGWSGFAVVGDLAVTLEQRGEQQVLVARDARSGADRWSHAWPGHFDHALGGPGPRATPLVDPEPPGGRVFAQGPHGRVVCVDARDGGLLWEFDLRAHLGLTREDDDAAIAYGRSGSPLRVGPALVVPGGGRAGGPMAGLVALDARSGEVLWEGPPFQISHASPALATVAGQELLLSVNEASVSGHDPADGRLLWEHPWPGTTGADANTSQPVLAGEDRLLLSKGYGAGCTLLRLVPGEAQWSVETLWASSRSLRTKLTSAVARGGHAYGLSDGILECVSLADGSRVWKQGRFGHGQVLLAGDLLVVTTEEGEVLLVEASPGGGGEVLARRQVLDGKTWNTAALCGDLLVVRNGREAVGLELPLAGG